MPDLTDPQQTRLFFSRPLAGTVCFYAFMTVLIIGGEYISPSGPCTPGLGILPLLLLPFLSAGLFLVALIRAIKGHRSQLIPAVLHGLVVLTSICLWGLGG